VIVSVDIPDELPALIVKVDVEPPGLGTIGLVLNVAIAPFGNPLTLRLTGELKPPDDVTLTV